MIAQKRQNLRLSLVWVSSDGRFFGQDEHLARWNGSTHTKCDCGEIFPSRSYCESCRTKRAREKYLALKSKEYDGSPVVYWDGDDYFFTEDDLISYMEDHELQEIDLLFCEENGYSQVDSEYWADVIPDTSDDVHPRLRAALDELNKVIEGLPAASYCPGKIRTTYKLS